MYLFTYGAEVSLEREIKQKDKVLHDLYEDMQISEPISARDFLNHLNDIIYDAEIQLQNIMSSKRNILNPLTWNALRLILKATENISTSIEQECELIFSMPNILSKKENIDYMSIPTKCIKHKIFSFLFREVPNHTIIMNEEFNHLTKRYLSSEEKDLQRMYLLCKLDRLFCNIPQLLQKIEIKKFPMNIKNEKVLSEYVFNKIKNKLEGYFISLYLTILRNKTMIYEKDTKFSKIDDILSNKFSKQLSLFSQEDKLHALWIVKKKQNLHHTESFIAQDGSICYIPFTSYTIHKDQFLFMYLFHSYKDTDNNVEYLESLTNLFHESKSYMNNILNDDQYINNHLNLQKKIIHVSEHEKEIRHSNLFLQYAENLIEDAQKFRDIPKNELEKYTNIIMKVVKKLTELEENIPTSLFANMIVSFYFMINQENKNLASRLNLQNKKIDEKLQEQIRQFRYQSQNKEVLLNYQSYDLHSFDKILDAISDVTESEKRYKIYMKNDRKIHRYIIDKSLDAIMIRQKMINSIVANTMIVSHNFIKKSPKVVIDKKIIRSIKKYLRKEDWRILKKNNGIMLDKLFIIFMYVEKEIMKVKDYDKLKALETIYELCISNKANISEINEDNNRSQDIGNLIFTKINEQDLIKSKKNKYIMKKIKLVIDNAIYLNPIYMLVSSLEFKQHKDYENLKVFLVNLIVKHDRETYRLEESNILEENKKVLEMIRKIIFSYKDILFKIPSKKLGILFEYYLSIQNLQRELKTKISEVTK